MLISFWLCLFVSNCVPVMIFSNSFEVSLLTYMTHEALNLLVSVNFFDQVSHEIFQNRCLKTNIGNTEIKDLFPLFEIS